MTEKSYVTEVGDGWNLAGSRVSLDSIVHDYLSGLTPERIVENFPTLTLDQVPGAIAFYLSHREEVDASIKRHREKFEKLREEQRRKRSK